MCSWHKEGYIYLSNIHLIGIIIKIKFIVQNILITYIRKKLSIKYKWHSDFNENCCPFFGKFDLTNTFSVKKTLYEIFRLCTVFFAQHDKCVEFCAKQSILQTKIKKGGIFCLLKFFNYFILIWLLSSAPTLSERCSF